MGDYLADDDALGGDAEEAAGLRWLAEQETEKRDAAHHEIWATFFYFALFLSVLRNDIVRARGFHDRAVA